ncbi:gamma carbonic anhydrase family protein [Oceanicoccus sagamiensis]|uniref:Gamma carbonic anhydrase family protein n=1 Tax=Oceanicoccus sagamiensis TaxID=716816 RepID=A0A1X9NDT9_9GAMM|nr:gamma carbonic anhydrase family protein [Oceanicoccus sagamiensis]ARN74055.1 gamma carbonic anhydrase family protein [Oceanicoccus sagamiensis]
MSTPNPAHIRPFKGVSPTLEEGAYVDPAAVVIGDVVLGKDTSIWPLVVIRGDVNKVRIGNRSNIQDGSVIHESRPRPTNPEGYPVIIGEDVTVGHKVMLHGCKIGNRVLVGMGAIVLDGVVIEDDVIVGAGALVTPGKTLESGYLYTGSPARQARPIRDGEMEHFVQTAQNYVVLKEEYIAEG